MCNIQYTRTAEREASLIRPMEILQKTMDYLLNLLDQSYDDRLLGLYNFLWDRMRAVRMDLRMQHLFNLGAITMLEQMVCSCLRTLLLLLMRQNIFLMIVRPRGYIIIFSNHWTTSIAIYVTQSSNIMTSYSNSRHSASSVASYNIGGGNQFTCKWINIGCVSSLVGR